MEAMTEAPREANERTQQPLVAIENLRVEFNTEGGTIVAVDDVSFTINPGETVCLVGDIPLGVRYYGLVLPGRLADCTGIS